MGGVVVFYAAQLYVRGEIPRLMYGNTGVFEKPDIPARVLFVGDIMLGRRVETLAKQYGATYPFQGSDAILADADLTLANLEGPIPLTHVHTPDLTYQFSFDEHVLETLMLNGIDMLSLANNHTGDYGRAGFLSTVVKCAAAQLTCVGDPDMLSTSSLSYRTISDVRVGFIMIHATVAYPDPAVIASLLATLRADSDVQVAFIHWGNEYSLTHNRAQEAFAHILIDGGVDAVVGHHPHVVEDIGMYNGKPIFYSLGNFIFDQYFNEDVQEGLGVRMDIYRHTIEYTLIPFESSTTRSQPRLSPDPARALLIVRALHLLTNTIGVNSVLGTIVVPR
jgi:poly-gamma-glutamate synthesis protein (capsule biosynthesis protein)